MPEFFSIKKLKPDHLRFYDKLSVGKKKNTGTHDLANTSLTGCRGPLNQQKRNLKRKQ